MYIVQAVCMFAALNGALDVLQYARDNDCPWDERTCSFAAEGGHLEVLEWARSQGNIDGHLDCA